MNLRPARVDDLDVNITPLIDVVFLLLIFFMVTTTFTKETQLKLNLPEADAEQREVEKEKIDIAIDADGRYYVNQHQLINIKSETLSRAIRKTAKNNRKMPIVISGDANVEYQAVATVLSVTSQLGFTNITLPTKQPSE